MVGNVSSGLFQLTHSPPGRGSPLPMVMHQLPFELLGALLDCQESLGLPSTAGVEELCGGTKEDVNSIPGN